ncbi:hypothetical protein D3C76_1294980 [compost metagenome]
MDSYASPARIQKCPLLVFLLIQKLGIKKEAWEEGIFAGFQHECILCLRNRAIRFPLSFALTRLADGLGRERRPTSRYATIARIRPIGGKRDLRSARMGPPFLRIGRIQCDANRLLIFFLIVNVTLSSLS